MASPFDDIFAEADAELAAPIVGPSSTSPFDDIFQEADAELGSMSDIAGIRNAAVKGLSSAVSFAGEFAPAIEKKSVFAPRLFGLSKYLGFEQPEISPAESGRVLSSLARERGYLDEAKPRSELGQLTADVVEQGLSAAPFGPGAIFGSAVTSGPGAYTGRKLGGDTGATIGAVVSPFAIAGAKSLARAGAKYLGPTASKLPGVPSGLGKYTTEQAVGETLRKAVTKPDDVITALKTGGVDEFATASEKAQSGGLALLEDTMRARGAEPLTELSGLRAESRLSKLGQVEDLTTYERSKEIEGALSASAKEVKKVEDALWTSIPKKTPVSVGYKIKEIADDVDQITLQGSIPLSGSATGLLNRLEKAEDGVMTVEQLQSLRSDALRIGRDTARGGSEAERVTNRIAGKIADRLVEAVDDSASIGVLPEETANVWSAARAATKGKYEVFAPETGIASKATKSALKGLDQKDAEALREGMKSPDLLAAQVKAAALGGQDLTPIYQDAFKAELSDLPQWKWPEYLSKNQRQLEIAFETNPEGLKNILTAGIDAAAEQAKNKLSKSAFAGQSATFSRTSASDFIDTGKGLAAIPAYVSGGANLGLAGAGAGYGYSQGETLPEKLILGAIGGGAGLIGGKALGSSIQRASEAYDQALVNALRNPKEAARLMESAAPGAFGRNLEAALREARAPAAQKGVSSLLGSETRESIPFLPSQTFEEEDMSKTPEFEQKAAEVADRLGVEPMDLLKVIGFETGGSFSSTQKNKAGSGATGLIQFMPETAREILRTDTKEEAIFALEQMSPVEQLDVVERYLSRYKGKIKTLDDLYMAVLYPKAIDKDANYALFKDNPNLTEAQRRRTAYGQNKGLDLNKDGRVTKNEAASKVRNYDV